MWMSNIAAAAMMLTALRPIVRGISARDPFRRALLLGIALGASLIVNLVLVYVALRPLTDLESTATRLTAGDVAARVPASRLADRDMARVGTTLNALLDRLT